MLNCLERRAVVEVRLESDLLEFRGNKISGQVDAMSARPAAFELVGRQIALGFRQSLFNCRIGRGCRLFR